MKRKILIYPFCLHSTVCFFFCELETNIRSTVNQTTYLFMDNIIHNCKDNPEFWEHLVRISEIIKKSKNSITDTSNQNLTNEVEKLKEINEKLLEENRRLNLKIEKLELLLKNPDSTGDNIKNEKSINERLLPTQDTILSENHYDDPDLTDISPVKSQNTESSEFTNDNKGKRKLIFDEDNIFKIDINDNNDFNINKKIKLESQSDDEENPLDVSQIDDSQESNQNNNTSIFQTILTNNNTIKDNKINLTQNPIHNRPWYPEDFIKNPLYEKFVSDKAQNYKSIPKNIANHFMRQQNYIKEVAMKDFNMIALGGNNFKEHIDSLPSNKENYIKNNLITPPQNCKENFSNNLISPIFKFEINKQNLDKYLQYFPNLLRTKKVRNWEIEDSVDNDVCADFLLTQDVQERNKKAKEKSKLKGLKMLFQSCFCVENGKQIGTFIMRDRMLNEKICNSEFVIDISIFQ